MLRDRSLDDRKAMLSLRACYIYTQTFLFSLFILQVLQSLYIAAISLHHHLLRGVDSVHLQILQMDTCRQCGSVYIEPPQPKVSEGTICDAFGESHCVCMCGRMQLGLWSLTKLILGVDLDKTSSVRRSNWEAEVLTPQQVKQSHTLTLLTTSIIIVSKHVCK